MKIFFFYLSMIIVSVSGSLYAQSGVHQHDGFFLRMAAGIGYAQLVEDDVSGSDLKFSGPGSPARIQIGGTVSDNLIIYGELGGISQTEPKMEWKGKSSTGSGITVSVYDIGAGGTYYLMPGNFYLSLSLLLSQSEFKYNNLKSDSKFGFGLNFMLGKEWWVGDDWALGCTVYGYFSNMNDKGSSEESNNGNPIHNFSYGVMFSATYN
jgi:hypothetical protein